MGHPKIKLEFVIDIIDSLAYITKKLKLLVVLVMKVYIVNLPEKKEKRLHSLFRSKSFVHEDFRNFSMADLHIINI